MKIKNRHALFFALLLLATISCGYKIPRKDRHPEIPDFPDAKGSQQFEVIKLELNPYEMDQLFRRHAQAKEDKIRQYDFVTLKNVSSGNHFGCRFKPEGISYYVLRLDNEELRFKINETLDRKIAAFEGDKPDELILLYGYVQLSWERTGRQTDVYLVRRILQSD